MAAGSDLAAALRTREEELSSVGAGPGSGTRSIVSLVSEPRDAVGREDNGEVNSGSKEEHSSAGPGSARHSGVLSSGHQSAVSAAKVSKDCFEKQEPGSSAGPSSAQHSAVHSGSGHPSAISSAKVSQDSNVGQDKQDKLERLNIKADEAMEVFEHKVEKVAKLKEKEVFKLMQELETTKKWAFSVQRERDELEAQAAGMHALLKQKEVAKVQSQEVAKAAKAEVIEAQVKQEAADIRVEKERSDKKGRLDLLESQIAQAKDALGRVKTVAQEGYSNEAVIAKVNQQLQNVEEEANFRLNLCGISMEGRAASSLGMASKIAGRQAPKARNSSLALQCIDEDDPDELDLEDANFDTQSRVAQSICVSSDAGELTTPTLDVGADMERNAKVVVLEKELEKERHAKGEDKQEKVDLKIAAAEQQAEIEILRKKVSYYIESEYAEARTKDEMRSELMGELIDNSKTQALLIDKDAQIANRAAEEVVNLDMMEERVALSKESLRIANLRIEDLKVELSHTSLRYEKQISLLERELQEARAGIGAAGVDEDAASSSLLYYKNLVEELQGELALTRDKLNATQVDSQIRFEEQKTLYDAETLDAQCKHKYHMEVLMTEHLRTDRSPQQPDSSSVAQNSPKSMGDTFDSLFQGCFQGVDTFASKFLGNIEERISAKSNRELLWELMATQLNLVVVSCSCSTLTVHQMSLEAFKLLGEGLPGEMIFQRMNSSSQAAMARRTVISRSVAKTTELIEWYELGSFEFTGATNKMFLAKMLALNFAHSPIHTGEDLVFIILLPDVTPNMSLGSAKGVSSRTRSSHSEDDVSASDSVSVSGSRSDHRTTLRTTR